MLVKTFGSAIQGINAITITIEVNIEDGINFFLVGLPDNAVKESHQRIEAALKNNGHKIPGKKIVINMAPANIRKEGSAYDLAIATAILAASGQINSKAISDYIIMGELSLDGGLQSIRGALPIAIEAKRQGFKGIILPIQNAQEAAVVSGLDTHGIESIKDIIGFFNGEKDLKRYKIDVRKDFNKYINHYDYDFSDVKGQENIKRAMEVAAAGNHNALFIGPPGSGKTMLARRLPSILPPLSLQESLETTKIHSVAGLLGKSTSLMPVRPFRSPHHTISDAGLVGGGSYPQPGEISLAHNGVLFLDELPEFKRSVLEVMRQPMEDGLITVARARLSVQYPANFMLVAAMNPCPCGYYNHPEQECVCSPGAVQKYMNRISGPLLDRIDIHLEVIPVPFKELTYESKGETSEDIRNRVIKARKIQEERFINKEGIHTNSQMHSRQLNKYCALDNSCRSLLRSAMDRLKLSARAYSRILKVARTIADLEGSEKIKTEHIAETINYRNLDRESWGKSSLVG